MSKPVTIPNAFAAQTGPIPLSQLDADFTAVATAINDPATYQNYVVDTGAANAYVATPAPAWSAYTAGNTIQVLIATLNTGASTLNVSGLGTKAITKLGANALTGGELPAGAIASLQYDGTRFQLLTAPIAPVAVEVCDFRLTLTSGTPVTTADVTGATTVYCSPITGNRIALCDGSATWNLYTSAEFSIALGTLTSGLSYDVFCYANSGVPTLELLAWTSGTARATALTTQNGVLVKTGATTRRYLGTFYTTATTTTEDSARRRLLWNYYNRKPRPMSRQESTASWTYTTATVRQANASTTNQLEVVIGVQEDAVSANLQALYTNNTASTFSCAAGLGLDVTNSINIGNGGASFIAGSNAVANPVAQYCGFPGLGYHFIAWLESSTATGTGTWYGNLTTAGATVKGGLTGTVMA